MTDEDQIPQDIVDAVQRTHEYLVSLFHGRDEEAEKISIENIGADYDIFLWVREAGMTPSARPAGLVADIHWYEPPTGYLIEFQLYTDGDESDFTVEAQFDREAGTVSVHDIHVL